MRVANLVLVLLAPLSIFADASSTIRPALVAPLSSTSKLLIPAAGSLQGGNGTFFKTDVTLTNFRNADQKVLLRWMPRGVSGNTVTAVSITIPRLSVYLAEDFVGEVLRQSGLGSILVTAVRSDDSDDPDGKLHSTARIWTYQPNSSGTVSQTFPTIPFSAITRSRLTILGHRQDARYRTNVGVVNLDPNAYREFAIHVYDGTTDLAQININLLPPMSMQQVPLPAFIVNPVFLRIEVTSLSPPGLVPFTAYGASVDNITGDGWSTVGFVAPGD